MKPTVLTFIVAAALCFVEVSRASAQSVPLSAVPANKHIGAKAALLTAAVIAGIIMILAVSVPRD